MSNFFAHIVARNGAFLGRFINHSIKKITISKKIKQFVLMVR